MVGGRKLVTVSHMGLPVVRYWWRGQANSPSEQQALTPGSNVMRIFIEGVRLNRFYSDSDRQMPHPTRTPYKLSTITFSMTHIILRFR
jgi:hypothetical protein